MQGPSVRINAEVSTDNALVVACFPSVGMVSSVVAHFLIEHLQLEFIGGVVDPRLPALTLVQEGVPLPPIRAYAGKPQCTIEGCDQVILLMSELVVPEALAHDIVWAMFEWSKEQKIVAGVVIDAFAKSGMKANLTQELESLATLENEYIFDYLLDEGRTVSEMPDDFKTYHNEIQGCQSRVWIIAEQTGNVWNFAIDSDAFIVKGLGKLVTTAFNGSSSSECLDIKFADFGLISRFLTGQRQRGLQAIINNIHKTVR